jgi:hypothetical protein
MTYASDIFYFSYKYFLLQENKFLPKSLEFSSIMRASRKIGTLGKENRRI